MTRWQAGVAPVVALRNRRSSWTWASLQNGRALFISGLAQTSRRVESHQRLDAEHLLKALLDDDQGCKQC